MRLCAQIDVHCEVVDWAGMRFMVWRDVGSCVLKQGTARGFVGCDGFKATAIQYLRSSMALIQYR